MSICRFGKNLPYWQTVDVLEDAWVGEMMGDDLDSVEGPWWWVLLSEYGWVAL